MHRAVYKTAYTEAQKHGFDFDYDSVVQYPFGFSLSNTAFDCTLDKMTETGGTITVTFIVTNTGDREGDEVVQVYIAKPDAAVFRPAEELKGFARVHLAPGETNIVSIPLDQKVFSYWNNRTNRWAVEGGRYEVRVGASCVDIHLTADLTVKPDGSPSRYQNLLLPHYVSRQIQNMPKTEFEALVLVLSVAMPAYSQAFFIGAGVAPGIAPTLATVGNVLRQIVISYPAMKFWIMPQI